MIAASPISAALLYSARWPIFPAWASGPRHKKPHTAHGFYDASRDEAQIRAWWARWPDALIAAPMGRVAGAVVLDIDIKNGVNGYDALEDISGALPLTETPMVHTQSGGVHIYFDPGDLEIRNSESQIGRGLDVRGDGGYVILPSPGSGYSWDPHCNFKTTALAPAPDWLTPQSFGAERLVSPAPRPPAGEIAPYGAKAINSAVSAIYTAPCGAQHATLNREAFGIGQLAGAGVVPERVALDALMHSALAMPSYDRRRPWRRAEVERTVRKSFEAGLRRPRHAR